MEESTDVELSLGRSIKIGDVTLTVVDIKDGKARLGIVAPPNVPVSRKEVHDALMDQKARMTEGNEITFALEIPEDTTEEEILAAIRDLADAADDIHRARGGHGLKIKDVQITEEVTSPVVPAEVSA